MIPSVAASARDEWERGFRGGVEFAKELPWAQLDELAKADFDVPRWITSWRNGWLDIEMGRARPGAVIASWLPNAARYLGSLVDPIGCDEFSFTRSDAYIAGFAEALRAVWHSIQSKADGSDHPR